MQAQLSKLLLAALFAAGTMEPRLAAAADPAHPCVGTIVSSDDAPALDAAIAECRQNVAANPDDTAGKYHFAVMLLRAGETAEARALLTPLAADGLAAAQIHLGTILQDQGETGAIEAAAWFYRAAAQGEPEALFLMGEIHANGAGVPQSDAVAVQWYELAAGQGHADAMYRLALALRNGRGIEPDERAALAWLGEAARSGNSRAMTLYGHALATAPNGTHRDEGTSWLRRAADNGIVDAQLWLARVHLESEGQLDEVIRLLTEAAEAGNDDAHEWLGLLLADTDPAAARPWLEKAAAADRPNAAFRLATLAFVNDRDEQRALHWSRQAAVHDHPDALIFLGQLLSASNDRTDLDEAATALRRADSLGATTAKPLLARLQTIQAARAGDAAAQYALAGQSDDALTPLSDAERLGWLSAAASGGHTEAQQRLADAAFAADDIKGGLRWLTTAAEQGAVDAQLRLGRLYSGGGPVAPDPDKARMWFARAADQGDVNAGYRLARLHFEGQVDGIAPDHARGWLEAAADNGNPDAQFLLGRLHRDGQTVAADPRRAAEWLTRAAEAGHAGAQHALAGLARAHRLPVSSSIPDLLRSAATQGHTEAQYELARTLEDGDLLTPDDAAAARWYRAAADAGHADAQYRLARLYGEGRGVDQDWDAAMRLFSAAAAQGVGAAETDIGVLYQLGWGVQRDLDKALEWYRRAADKGDPRALRNLANLTAETPGAPSTLTILPAADRPGSRW